MEETLIKLFGLMPEEYRLKFIDTHKGAQQTWVDFVDASVKALEGWITGRQVDNYDGLYNLLQKEHILTNCPKEVA